MIETDDLISINTRCTTTPNPPELDVEFPTQEELQWDDSPEQFALSNHNPRNSYTPTPPIEQPQMSSSDTDSPLTDLPPDSDEVFSNPMSKSRSLRLRRSHAFRRRRPRSPHDVRSPEEEYGTSDEESVPESQPTRGQPYLHPKHPEEVQLGPAVQNLEAPLEAVQMILPSTPSPRRARSNRMLLDYRQLHNYGSRRARL